ncbi:MAG: lipopolysaccharide heptosyltransferase II, partial [Deltaproteobacteria bacterium]|nr:lipopolysaccharide heptosyltransferase II [Deltaproteobacteria bacterium]
MAVESTYRHIRRILVLGTTWLGDSVMTLPTIAGLRELFPRSHIAIAARHEVAELYRAVPAVDEIIAFQKKSGLRAVPALAATAGRLHRGRFDLGLIFSRSFGAALMCVLARIPHRVGFDAGIRNVLLSRSIERDRSILDVHQVHYYKKLLAPLGLPQFPELPELQVSADMREWARTLLEVGSGVPRGALVALNPGATYGQAKQWLPERFAELAKRLVAHHGCRIVLIGAGAGRDLARQVGKGIEPYVLDLTGRTTVLQLAAVLACCDLLVTNDTGPMHVAYAVGLPLVALFGSTDPKATAPLGSRSTVLAADIDCSPCLKRTCTQGHYRCMEMISVER